MPPGNDNLTTKTGRAFVWGYAGSFVRLFLSFGVNILLTRLLGPKPFGAIALALLLFGLGNLFVSVGITSALIRKQDLQKEDIRFCFTGQMTMGLFMSCLLFVTAPLWAQFFHQGDLTSILRVMSPLFALQSMGSTSSALLNRAHNTRAIQTASILSYIVGYLVLAVPMALLGYGVWSLVAAFLAQASFNSAMLYLRVRHSILPFFAGKGRGLFRFGISIFASNLCNWGISNLDNTIVGRVSGAVALGYYSRAFTLASLPADSIVTNLQQVLLPTFSRIQTERARLARGYLAAISLVAIVLFPVFWTMAAVPDVVVIGLYGQKWAPAVALFQPLALAIPVHALMAMAGPLLAARGRPHLETRLQFVVACIASVAYWWSVTHSILWLSWTVLIVYLVRFALLTAAVLKETGGKWLQLGARLFPACSLAVVVVLFTLAEVRIMPVLAPWLKLAVVALTAAVFTLIVLFSGRRFFLMPIVRDVPQIQSLLPARLRKFLPSSATGI